MSDEQGWWYPEWPIEILLEGRKEMPFSWTMNWPNFWLIRRTSVNKSGRLGGYNGWAFPKKLDWMWFLPCNGYLYTKGTLSQALWSSLRTKSLHIRHGNFNSQALWQRIYTHVVICLGIYETQNKLFLGWPRWERPSEPYGVTPGPITLGSHINSVAPSI